MSIQVVDRPGGGGGGGQTGDVNLVGVSGAPIALGPAAAGESFPTVLPDSQISALTPPEAITNYAQETGGNLAILAGLASVNGLLVNTSGTPQGSFFMSPTLQISAVVKAAPGTLLSCNGRLDGQANTGQYFLQFYDSATVPSDGPVTILRCETIEHIQNYSTAIDFEYLRGKTASSGISFALSTTEFTKTLATGETYLSLEVEYK